MCPLASVVLRQSHMHARDITQHINGIGTPQGRCAAGMHCGSQRETAAKALIQLRGTPLMGEGQSSGFSAAVATLKRSPWLIADTAVTHELGSSLKQTSPTGQTRLPPVVQMTPHVASADFWSVPQRASAGSAVAVRGIGAGTVQQERVRGGSCRRGCVFVLVQTQVTA